MAHAVVANRNALLSFADYFKKRLPSLGGLLPKHLTGERVMKIAIGAVSRNPALMQCTPESVWLCVANAASLGLEVNLLGAAYLVPFRNNKTNKSDCQLIVGYQGLIDLCRRSGNIVSIEARVVREKDEFDLDYGRDRPITHKPFLGDGGAGTMRLVYAVAILKDGGRQTELMTRSDVDAIRKRSRAGFKENSPWMTDYEEMARKTVVRRLVKYLPKSIELSTALAAEDRAEDGHSQFAGMELSTDLDAFPEAEAVEAEENSKTKQLAGALRQVRQTSESVDTDASDAPGGEAATKDHPARAKAADCLRLLSQLYDTRQEAVDRELLAAGLPAIFDIDPDNLLDDQCVDLAAKFERVVARLPVPKG